MQRTIGQRRRVLAGTALVAILVAGCTGGSDDSAAEPPAQGEADVDVAAEATQAAGADDEAERSGPDTADLQVIYTGTITLSSDDPDETAAQVRQRATAAGGYVAGADLRRDDLGLLTGTITIRVPADNYDLLRQEVSDTAADVVGETATTEDVTDRLRDLDAQVRNLEALEEQLLVLLEDARLTGDPSQIIEVFDRINDVRLQIEQLEATQAGLEDRVALSTLTVEIRPSRSLVAAAEQVPAEDRPLPWSPGNQAESAWDSTVSALQGFVDLVIWLVVTVIPVAVVWLSPLLLLVLALRWWRRRHPREPRATGTGWGPTGGDGGPTPPPLPPAVPAARSGPGGGGATPAPEPDDPAGATEASERGPADGAPADSEHRDGEELDVTAG